MLTDPVIKLWLSGLLFALIHSLTASVTVKTFFYRKGVSAQGYRLGYVLLALVTTTAWLVYIHRLPDQTLFVVQPPLRWINYAIQALAIGCFILALQPIDIGVFLGIKRMPEQGEPFIETGIYRYQRHPMYAALILLLWASPDQSVNSMNLYALVTLYCLLGSRLEERRLMHDHPEYGDYRRRVAAFIPHFRTMGPE
ncbi:MAG: isoprenylcysteine carboxylmethyltransferase family protein [Gammaproteobacteria bacterium]|nr:MAG: isoprenylcysteine carboxylmethyltransferase family protein [Gammaproteobacteria bacterium]